jgi:hypothetical protein
MDLPDLEAARAEALRVLREVWFGWPKAGKDMAIEITDAVRHHRSWPA